LPPGQGRATGGGAGRCSLAWPRGRGYNDSAAPERDRVSQKMLAQCCACGGAKMEGVMEFTVQGRGLEVTPDLREYLAKRLRRLDRHLAQNASGVVEIARLSARQADDRMVVQVTISSNGALLRAEQHAADPRPAIDAAVDVLDRQVSRVKGRRNKRGHISLGQLLEAPAWSAARISRCSR
ncbi:MAG: ribosome-associated translation inhibitor RaiA, partial [Chloroflexi bacterium]|nr:ribosome-associated translation inhibitor RaiA [Chloroflexota bacterium]